MANFESNTERVNAIVAKINAEALSLGAVIRNFVEVAKEDEYAKYMLQTICNYHNDDALIVLKVNDIKKAVIAAYPYKNEENVLLVKRDGIYVPIEKYTGVIVSKAFYNAVGATRKPKGEIRQATSEELAAVETKREERKQKAANTRALDKANRELLEKFWDEMMKCTEANAWDTLMKYKTACTETEVTAK